MKNALILHGAGNNSKGNWFPWLKEELQKKGYKVWVPDLPGADRPNQAQWLEIVKDWKFEEDSVMIGHSAGATLILRILERLPSDTVINKAILVAGPVQKGKNKPEYFPYKEDLMRQPFQWEKIKNSCKNFYLIYSDNDPYECGIDQGEIICEHLEGELIFKPGQGHFNLEAGERYRAFPELLSYL